MYYTYIIECEDTSLYTGVAKNIGSRMSVHIKKIKKSAKYTRSHTFKALRAVWESDDRSKAQKLEYRIKQLTRAQKLCLIEDNLFFCEYFKILDEADFRRINEIAIVC